MENMENKLANLENILRKSVSNYMVKNRVRIYFFVFIVILTSFFSKLPFLNLIFNSVVNYALILFVSIILFRISAKLIFFLLMFLLFLIAIMTLFSNSLKIEVLSSLAFISFVFMVAKLIIEYDE